LNDPNGRYCICDDGYQSNGALGCIDINACLSTPCGTNTQCADRPAPALGDASGRICTCNLGTMGNPETSCS
jgi:hypothetical protein